jgi:hypothetical protein
VTEHHISVSQFAELLGYEPTQIRFVAFKPTDSSVAVFVEDRVGTCDHHVGGWSSDDALIECPTCHVARLVPLKEVRMQTSGTCPPLSNNTSTRKPKGKGKK